MTENQIYGVLRVIGVKQVHPPKRRGKSRPSAKTVAKHQDYYTASKLLEERSLHLLTRRETSIGRALDNHIILLDPTVSRAHALLTLDDQGWSIHNLTASNTVAINGQPILSGEQHPLHPQDFIQIGGTLLQLVAPALPSPEVTPVSSETSASLSSFLPLGHSQKRSTQALDNLFLTIENPPIRSPGKTSPGAQTWHGETANDDGDQLWEEDSVTWRTTLWQRLGLRMRWVLLVVGLLVFAMFAVGSLALNNGGSFSILIQQGPLNLLGALTIPLIPALGITLLINFIDRFEREPWLLRFLAFLWGAIIAVPSAALIEDFFDRLITSNWGADLGLHPFLQGLNAGVTEETVKGLGLLLLFLILRDEFDNVTDGIVYGALIGAGFAMVENFFYFADNQADWPVLIVGRIVLGWLCHSTFTVCFGAALGYIRHTRIRWQRILIPLLGYFLAIGLHTVFDFINTYIKELIPAMGADDPAVLTISVIVVVGNYLPPFIAQISILYVLMKALAHEAAVIREFLAPEVSTGVITVDDYALLQNSVARKREERKIRRQGGLKQYWRIKSLYQAEIGLAFRKWHISMGDEPRLGYVKSEDTYRQRIRQIRQQIQTDEQERAREHRDEP